MAVVPGGRLREHGRAGENFRHERAPQSAGIWRIRLGSGSPITGDCLLVVLTWVGNNYFGHAAAALPRRPSNGCLAPLGVLLGLLTEARIEQHIGNYVCLWTCRTIPQTPCCVCTCRGRKTTLAHLGCVLNARMEKHRNSTPRHLVLYTVPTRTLREGRWCWNSSSSRLLLPRLFIDVCVQIALSVHFKSVWLSKTTLLTWKGGLKW